MRSLQKILLAGVSFMLLLLLARMWFTQSLLFGFLAWNTFLAFIPCFLSARLQPGGTPTFRKAMKLAGWLLFFPNAPYLLTDLFHFHARPPVPVWFDLILFLTAAWNGLWLGIVSLMQVESFMKGWLSRRTVHYCLAAAALLCGYGIYIGRFLRFNSWDVATAPGELLANIVVHFIHPLRHAEVWAFTALFAMMFGLFYAMVKTLHSPASAGAGGVKNDP